MKQEAFIELIQVHSGIIHKILYLYVDDADDKADLKQEIILQAWQSIGNFRGQSAFSTWLYRVALNTVLTYQRKAKKRPERKGELQDVPLEPTTEHPATEMLYRAIRQMNDIDKTIITLHLEEYDNAEIGEIMGLTKNHVAVKLHRIKNELTKMLKG